ncbi:MvdC/MvdD family ATP grasp protein [Streptomyces sp. NPDC059578]|uniref:MvdC/MvdD family ATP grasp protein n=1 Tax=Streptomyces sp. NPDC059578 TaxID=3346874 RepID=UPI0036AF8EA3
MTVLVLTRRLHDSVSDGVITELADRDVPVYRMDPGDFPESAGFTARIEPGLSHWETSWRGQRRGLRLEEVTAVYYRRPNGFRLHPGLSGQDAQWARAEARAGIGGVLTSLDCTWVNHPHDNARAGVAPLALKTASACGLTVPRTLITNDPQEARDFITDLPGKRAAYKALGHVGASTHAGQRYALWTSRITSDDITDDLGRTAHLLQEWIDKSFEVRLTAVGPELFAGAIHAGSEASRIDFRRDYDSLTYSEIDVPPNVRRGVRALMGAFGLRYVAMDFVVGPDGLWNAVDINPNGQFGFIPHLREPITRALADLLEGAMNP